MRQIPISLITIFHPEIVLDLKYESLRELPHLRKNRIEQEKTKGTIAVQQNRKQNKRVFHGREILNFGESNYSLRKTILDGIILRRIVQDYSTRLVYTESEVGQAAYKFEIRPNWGSEPNLLPENVLNDIYDYIEKHQMSIRQLWINPFTRSGLLNLKGAFYELGETANLMLGPFDNSEIARKAKIKFNKHVNSTAIHEHHPFYKEVLGENELKIIDACNLWLLVVT